MTDKLLNALAMTLFLCWALPAAGILWILEKLGFIR